MVRGPDGRVWFPSADPASGTYALGVATRSGTFASQVLPGQDDSALAASGIAAMTFAPDGNLWYTDGVSVVGRISGLDSVAGGLDDLDRPTHAPDFVAGPYGGPSNWTNVTTDRHPTFDGVARPGAEVTVSVQKQGQDQPVEIGHVRASRGDGAWTMTSRLRLGNGDYAVTATQSGDTSPPAVLYSLQPDSYGNLSDALVIVSAPRSKKEESLP